MGGNNSHGTIGGAKIFLEFPNSKCISSMSEQSPFQGEFQSLIHFNTKFNPA
jgi:hypothetical protein